MKSKSGLRDNERRLVLIGKTGRGKSATGNTILGKIDFHSAMSAKSVTDECQIGIVANRFGKKIVLVDTPGLFDSRKSNEIMFKEICKCISMTAPGPHAIILVVEVSRFTKEEQDTVDYFAQHFGEEMFRFLIVLFTRKDNLENQTIHSYVNNVPDELKLLIEKSSNRYVAFNNKSPDKMEKENDVKTLLELVEVIKKENGDSHYTNEMYQHAEEKVLQRMEEIRLRKEKQKKEEREMIEREVMQKHQPIIEAQNRENNKLRMKMEQLEKEMKQQTPQENEAHQRQIENILQKMADIEHAKAKDKRSMEYEMNKRLTEVEEKHRQDSDPESERDSIRVREGKGFIGHIGDGIVSVGKAFASLLPW